MKDFKNMTGLNNLYHDSNGRKYQEMGQIMNSKLFSRRESTAETRPPVRSVLSWNPGESKRRKSSHLSIHSYYFLLVLTPLPAKNTFDRNEAAHEGWDDLATILCSFPKYFVKEIEFWSPLFRTVLGKTIEECRPPPIEKDLWYDSKNDLETESITDLFTDFWVW